MTDLQKRFIDILDEYGYDIFSIDMVKATKILDNKKINQVIRTLTRSGYLIKLERGKYIRSGFIDSNVIANFLAPDGGIAYWTALNYHGLTEQFTNTVFVQSAKRKTEELTINNMRYKIIKVDKKKIIGYTKAGYGNHQYKITDVEKTIVDCFEMPHLAGWYQEIIKAFNNAKLNQNKLIKYCKVVNNYSVIKRLAFLTEFLNKPNMDKFLNFAQKNINKDYSIFEIGNERKGEFCTKWKLIINMDKGEISEIANS